MKRASARSATAGSASATRPTRRARSSREARASCAAQAGAQREPFETIVPLATPLEPDTLRRLEAHGMTGRELLPVLASRSARRSTLAQKREQMLRFGESGDREARQLAPRAGTFVKRSKGQLPSSRFDVLMNVPGPFPSQPLWRNQTRMPPPIASMIAQISA